MANLSIELGLDYHCSVDNHVCDSHISGNLYRQGQLYTTEPIEVCDHDFPSLATGVAIPHGLYDMTDNVGYIQIGTSHDTSEFACDSIRYWWQTQGKQRYPLANSILLLCDGGSSNSSRYYIFKQDLQALVTNQSRK
jgi:hypothetical protein